MFDLECGKSIIFFFFRRTLIGGPLRRCIKQGNTKQWRVNENRKDLKTSPVGSTKTILVSIYLEQRYDRDPQRREKEERTGGGWGH